MDDDDLDFLFSVGTDDEFRTVSDTGKERENEAIHGVGGPTPASEEDVVELKKRRRIVNAEDRLGPEGSSPVFTKKIQLRKREEPAESQPTATESHAGVPDGTVRGVESAGVLEKTPPRPPKRLRLPVSTAPQARLKQASSRLFDYSSSQKTPSGPRGSLNLLSEVTGDLGLCFDGERRREDERSIHPSEIGAAESLWHERTFLDDTSSVAFYTFRKFYTEVFSSTRRTAGTDVLKKQNADKVHKRLPNMGQAFLTFHSPTSFGRASKSVYVYECTEASNDDKRSKRRDDLLFLSCLKQHRKGSMRGSQTVINGAGLSNDTYRSADLSLGARQEDNGGSRCKTKMTSEVLWTQKYLPKGFLDLLTDEMFNRNVLKWLKEFETKQEGSSFSSSSQTSNMADTRGRGRSSQLSLSRVNRRHPNEAVDGFSGRKTVSLPQGANLKLFKSPLLLIGGPSGAGKSTAVHVLARLAGYNVVEVNAQEHSTKDQLLQVIRNVAQLDASTMETFIVSKKAPPATNAAFPTVGSRKTKTLLLLNEIERAERPALEALIALLQEEDKKTGRPVIKRPIVCCSQDPYDHVLRPLRTKVTLLTVKPFSLEKILKRLNTICTSEGVPVDADALIHLIRFCEGDMRFILNTLEFLSRGLETGSSSNRLTVQIVKATFEMFQKDRTLDCVSFLSQLFFHKTGQTVLFSKTGDDMTRFIDTALANCADIDVFFLTLQDNLRQVQSFFKLAKQGDLYGFLFFENGMFVSVLMTPVRSGFCGFLDLVAEADCIRKVFHSTAFRSFICPFLFTHLYCYADDGSGSRNFTGRFTPYPMTLGARAKTVAFRRKKVRQELIMTCLVPKRFSIVSTDFVTDTVFWLTLMTSPPFIFAPKDLTWKRYHTLTSRPVAGQPLGTLLDPTLSRFHHMVELLTLFGLRFSKTPSVDVTHDFMGQQAGYGGAHSSNSFRGSVQNSSETLNQLYWTQKNAKSFLMPIHGRPHDSAEALYLDPPLHLFLECFFRSFYQHISERRLTVYRPRSFFPSISDKAADSTYQTQWGGQTFKRGSPNDLVAWSPHLRFKELNTFGFDGFDYVNLQLQRVHGELLRQELLQAFQSQGETLSHSNVTSSPIPNLDGSTSHKECSKLPLEAVPLSPFQSFQNPPLLSATAFSHYIENSLRQRKQYELAYWRTPHGTSGDMQDGPAKQQLFFEPTFYVQLFDAGVRCTKRFIYRYESGDAKAVRYSSSVADFLDPRNL